MLSPDGQITNSLNNAIAMVKANRDRNWIAGIWAGGVTTRAKPRERKDLTHLC